MMLQSGIIPFYVERKNCSERWIYQRYLLLLLLHFLALEDSNGHKIPSRISHYLTWERFLPDLLDADLGFTIGFILCMALGGPLPCCVIALRFVCHSTFPNTADIFSGMSLSGSLEWALQSLEGIKKKRTQANLGEGRREVVYLFLMQKSCESMNYSYHR